MAFWNCLAFTSDGDSVSDGVGFALVALGFLAAVLWRAFVGDDFVADGRAACVSSS